MQQSAIVVGGGICGLMSALLLKRSFQKVTLVEQSDSVGGLFRSIRDDLGACYDMGSHIPNMTGIVELDNILFGAAQERKQLWNEIKKLKSGNYFAGEWDLGSPFADSQKLTSEEYIKGCSELIQLTTPSEQPFIVPYCIDTLGPTFTKKIVEPILSKLYGSHTDLDTLTMAAGLFGFTRVLAFEADVANALKNIPEFDMKLGYRSSIHFQQRQRRDNSSTPDYFYPIEGNGIETWVELLLKQVKNAGVDVLYSTKVESMEVHKGIINCVQLSDRDNPLNCNFVFWSAPPSVALKAAGLDMSSAKPELRTAIVFHLNFDKPLLNKESHYLWVWDKSTEIFRLTLYPNLNPFNTYHNISAEILCHPEEVDSFVVDDIILDLVRMKIISEDTRCISHIKQVIHNTFPVPTGEFELNNQKNFDMLTKSLKNIVLSGRSSGKYWRQADVLVAAYQDIKSRNF